MDDKLKKKTELAFINSEERKNLLHKLDIINGKSVFVMGGYQGNVLQRYAGKSSVVKIPDIFLEIGYGAFLGNKYLETISMNENLRRIKHKAFKACKNLKIVKFNEMLYSIDNEAFSETAIETIKTPESLETIGNEAFKSCKSLKTAILNKGLTVIAEKAFKDTALEELVLPETLRAVWSYALDSPKLNNIYVLSNELRIMYIYFATRDLAPADENIKVHFKASRDRNEVYKEYESLIKSIYAAGIHRSYYKKDKLDLYFDL